MTYTQMPDNELTFQPHGNISISVKDDVATFHCTGPYNEIAINHLFEKVGELYVERDAPYMKEIVFLYDSIMMTKEAIDIFTQKVADTNVTGMQLATAFVVDKKIEGRFFIESIIEKYIQVGKKCKAFDSLEDAEKWMKEVIDTQ